MADEAVAVVEEVAPEQPAEAAEAVEEMAARDAQQAQLTAIGGAASVEDTMDAVREIMEEQEEIGNMLAMGFDGGMDVMDDTDMQAEPEAEPETAAGAESEPEAEESDAGAELEAVKLERDQLRAAKGQQDAEIAQLKAQAEADKLTIKQLTAQVTELTAQVTKGAEEGVPPEDTAASSEDEIDEIPSGGPSVAGGAAPGDEDGPSHADIAKRTMIEDMFASGTITEMEYEEMVERMEQEREANERVAAQAAAWQDVLHAFNDQSCKKGVAKMELEWNSLGIAEPYSAAAVARLFRKHAGTRKDCLNRGEIGEFLAGSKPFMVEVRDAYSDLHDFSGMSFVSFQQFGRTGS